MLKKKSILLFIMATFVSAGIFTYMNTVSVWSAVVSQTDNIKVILDGETVTLNHKPAMIYGIPMIPVEEVVEAAGWQFTENSPTVFKLMKSVKYTDGILDYLFSCHSMFINLELMCINRSIMVGVGTFLDKANDHNISFSTAPVIINGSLYMSADDTATSIYANSAWDEASQTVYITSGEIPYYDGHGLENRQELFDGMREYYKAGEILTRVGDPTAHPEITAPQRDAVIFLSSTNGNVPAFQPSGVMKSAPDVGSIPANILIPGKHDVMSADSYYEPYKIDVVHGCNWYAFGRFYETYGYQVPVMYTGGETYIDAVESVQPTTIRAERDADNIISGCIAVYWSQGLTGHVVFVEYVERDADGKPTYIYYTECMNTDKSGIYKPESDATIKKVSFERFLTSTSSKKDLMGFIVPN